MNSQQQTNIHKYIVWKTQLNVNLNTSVTTGVDYTNLFILEKTYRLRSFQGTVEHLHMHSQTAGNIWWI